MNIGWYVHLPILRRFLHVQSFKILVYRRCTSCHIIIIKSINHSSAKLNAIIISIILVLYEYIIMLCVLQQYSYIFWYIIVFLNEFVLVLLLDL